jgi:hypothetical protein
MGVNCEDAKAKNLEEFILELDKLTRKYHLKIGGCGCCGSPFISEVLGNIDKQAGYALTGDAELAWVFPGDKYLWSQRSHEIVRKTQ